MLEAENLVFAVVTAFAGEDWHSQRILKALERHGRAVAVDPLELSALLEPERLTVGVGGAFSGEGRPDAVVLARGLSPQADPDAQFSLYRALEQLGVPVINRIDALLDAQDKFRTSLLLQRARVPTPPAGLALSPGQAARLARGLGKVVIKPPFGSLGEGVELFEPGAAGEEQAGERARRDGAVYLQRYVPNPGRDLRVFVVGGRAVAAVERVASPGEFRTNIARGGTALPAVLTAGLAAVAQAAASALGLDYTGVDVIPTERGFQVIEVNGNPSFEMFFSSSGLDMAVDIAAHVAARARERRSERQESPRAIVPGERSAEGAAGP